MKNAFMFVFIVALVGVAPPQARADGPDGALEGTWSVVAVTMNGIKATERIASKVKVTIRGNRLTLKPGLSVDGDGKVEPGNAEGEEATFTLDPAKSPGQIDLTFGSGANKISVKGIYAVEKGELKICFSPGARPADFANATDSGQTLLIAKRARP